MSKIKSGDPIPRRLPVPADATAGCHVQIFEDEDFGDTSLFVHGPAEYPNLRNLPDAGGKDWGDQIDSLITGPNCWLVVYADENFEDTVEVFGPNTQVRHLGGMGDEIDSIRIYDHAPAQYLRRLKFRARPADILR